MGLRTLVVVATGEAERGTAAELPSRGASWPSRSPLTGSVQKLAYVLVRRGRPTPWPAAWADICA